MAVPPVDQQPYEGRRRAIDRHPLDSELRFKKPLGLTNNDMSRRPGVRTGCVSPAFLRVSEPVGMANCLPSPSLSAQRTVFPNLHLFCP